MTPLTRAQARHIAHRLSDRDREEVLCVLPDHLTLDAWVDEVMANPVGERWVAVAPDGEPVAMGGITPSGCQHAATSWAVGTDRKAEAGSLIMLTAMHAHRRWVDRGVRRFACTCLAGPASDTGSAWLERLGYVREGLARGLGREGQDFIMWGMCHGR